MHPTEADTTAATESVLSDDQLQQWHDRGYFIVRNVIDRDEAMEIRGVLRNRILTPDVETRRDEVDPSDPMGNSPEARQARLRKLSNFCISSPLIWYTVHAPMAAATAPTRRRDTERERARRFTEQRPCRPLMIARSPLASQPGVRR
jgi:hypothetical protein